MREMLLAMLAISAMCMPMFGALIGLRKYRKQKEEIERKMNAEYKAAQEKGGVASLYYKHPEKRVFKRTFGMPMIIGFVVGMILLYITFKLI